MKFQKGDRATVRLNREDIEINRLLYKIKGDIVDIEIIKVNDGYNIWTHTDRNGYNRYMYITRKTFEEKQYKLHESDFKVRSYEMIIKYQDIKIKYEVSDKNILEIIKYGIPKNLDSTIQKAIDYCNKHNNDSEAIQKAINKYKKLSDLNSDLQREVYETILSRLESSS